MFESIGQILTPVLDFLKDFTGHFQPLLDWLAATKVPEQIEAIDYKGLFSNGWFLAPFIAFIAWNVYKKALNSIIFILLFTGSWAFFGTPYMKGIMGQDEIQLDSILPLLAGAVVVLGIAVYIFIFKSE